MKHGVMLFLTALLLVLMTSPGYAAAIPDEIAVMPDSLRIIEESAFEGTALTTVYLPETVTTIGRRAFADIKDLRVVFIPKATVVIDEEAFDGAGNLTIWGVPGSYAEEWAGRHSIRFVGFDIWRFAHEKPDFGLKNLARWPTRSERGGEDRQYRPGFDIGDIDTLTYPKEKPEMYPLDYDFP